MRAISGLHAWATLLCTALLLSPGAGGAAPAKDGWSTRELEDRMTGRTRILGTTSTRFQLGKDRGTVEVTAACGVRDQAGPYDWIALQYVVRAQGGRTLNLRWNAPVVTGVSRLTGAVHYQGGHAKPWVSLRVRVDAELLTASFEGDHANVAEIELSAPRVLLSRAVLTELPLEDGRTLVVEVQPQDERFRDFARRCFADPALVAHRRAAERTRSADKGTALVARLGLPDVPPPDPSMLLGPRARDGFILGSDAHRERREYSGIASGFQAHLPQFVRWHGLDPREYGAELRFIAEAARTCARLDAKKASKAPLKTYGADGALEIEDLSGLGPEYAVCDRPYEPQDVTAAVHGQAPRHLWMSIHPSGLPPRWKGAQVLVVDVRFEPREGDPEVSEDGRRGAYAVVEAAIRMDRR